MFSFINNFISTINTYLKNIKIIIVKNKPVRESPHPIKDMILSAILSVAEIVVS